MSTTIYKKLLEVKKKVPYLQKDKKGFNYSYTTPSSVLATINPLLNESGLLLITEVISSVSYQIDTPTKNDKDKKEWKYDLDFIFTWVDVESGEKINISFKASGVNGEDKGLGSALTYAERYFILKQFNIPTDSDDPDSFQDKYLSDEEKKEKNKFKISEVEAKELEGLINNSTLDASGRITATNSVLNAKNAKDIASIKSRLLQLQTAS